MNYALVENGNVTSIGLPQTGILKNGNTISGYNLLDEETLLAEGWLPFIDVLPDNSNTETFIQDGYTIELNRVVQKYKSIGIDSYRQDKINRLSEQCNQAVLDTFSSSALGSSHIYSFDYEAQMNFAGAKQAFQSHLLTTIDWNTRDAGVLNHSEAQFNQLWLDGFMHKVSTIGKYRTLKVQVESAVNKSEVDAIVW